MSYRIPLPTGSRRPYLDIVEPNSTAVQRFIRRKGLGAYETSTAAALLASCEGLDPGFVMFDVGANMGLYGELAASVFSPQAVHAFEPGTEAAAVIRKIAERNELPITVHEVAVSSKIGTAKLFLSPVSDASNSLVEGFRNTERTVDVATTTIDEVIRTTGVPPDLVKLDVETHERAVLDGARRTFECHRPALVVEVLRRRGRDHGEEISAFFDGLDYYFYELCADPDWRVHTRMRGSGTTDRDWLALPEPLPDRFGESWRVWYERLLDCDVSRNPRPPIVASARAAYRRGGLREVAATARRYVRQLG